MYATDIPNLGLLCYGSTGNNYAVRMIFFLSLNFIQHEKNLKTMK